MKKNDILLPLEVNTDILLNLNWKKLTKNEYELNDFIKEASLLFENKKVNVDRIINKTLSFLIRSGLLKKEKVNNKIILRFSNIFMVDYLSKYKFNFHMALQQFYEDMYEEIFDLKDKVLLNPAQAEENLKEIKNFNNEKTLKRQAGYVTSFINKIVFNKTELDSIIQLTGKSNNKITTDIKHEVFKIVLQNLSLKEELNEEKIKAIKKMIFDTNLLSNVIENNYNGSLEDFFANIVERPELSQEINFKEILPNFTKGYRILEKYINDNKDIVLFTDTDNDGTMANGASKAFKEKLGLANLDINYVKIYPESTVQHGINFVDVDNYLKNKYPNKKPEEIDILIATADNGSGNLEEIKKIAKKYPNVKFLITDHHNPQFTKEEAEKIPNLVFVNWHFSNKQKYLRGYELSGAQTWNLFLDEYLQNNYTAYFDIDAKERLNLTIENASQLGNIADMVNGYIQIFLGNEIRENFGKNINKLNAILTLENIINKFDKVNEIKLKELLKETFMIDNIDTFFYKLKNLKRNADILFIMEKFKDVLPSYKLDELFEKLLVMNDIQIKEKLLKAYLIDKNFGKLKNISKNYEQSRKKWLESLKNILIQLQEDKKISKTFDIENLDKNKVLELMANSKKLTVEDKEKISNVLNQEPELIKTINEFYQNKLSNNIDKELEKYQRYSSLYELRSIIVKYIAMPYIEADKEKYIVDLIDKSNILDNIKNLEKDMNNLLKDKIKELATKYEEGYSKLIVFNKNSIISRKLLLKLNPEINNGILIILDTIKDNEIYGSIRMKQFNFADVFNYDEENKLKEITEIKKFNNEVNKELKKYGIKVKYMGHEKGAAGFKIIGLKNAIKELKKEHPKLSDKELKDKLFVKLNNIFNEKYKLLKEYNIEEKKQSKIFINNINDLPLFMEVLNILKVPNFTHGDRADIKFVIPIKDLPLVNKYGTAHYKMNIEDLKNFPKEYLTTILNFDNNNIIYPRNLLLKALQENYKYLELDMLSPVSMMAQGYTNNKPKVSLSITERKQEIVKNYTKLFNKKNNYTIEMPMEEFFEKHFLVHDKKETSELIKYINNKLNEAKTEEWVVLDIEGIGFGNNNVLFNIQVNRLTKDGKVKITSLFINPKEIYGKKFMLSPAIQKLTGTTNKMLDKISLSIKEADKILTDLFKNNKNFILAAHNSPYDINGIETTLPRFSKLIKEKAEILDTAPIARQHSFAIDKTERLERSYIMSYDKNIPINRMLIGTYIGNHNSGINIENFLKNPYDGKTLLSEDEKFKLFIKKIDGKYKLYVQDLQKSAKPLYVSDVEDIYIIDNYRKFDPENLKIITVSKVIHAIDGKEVEKEQLKDKKGIKLIDKNIAKGATEGTEIDTTNIKAKKYSVSAIALQEVAEVLLEHIKNKNDLKTYYINKNEYIHTGIIDIDKFYEKILNNNLLNLNIQDENDFVIYNMDKLKNKILKNDLDIYINNYVINNNTYYTILDKMLNAPKLIEEFKKINKLDDKTFEKKKNTKKIQTELLKYKLEKVKDEFLKEIKNKFLRQSKHKKFNLKLIEKLSDIIANYMLNKYELNFKYSMVTEKQKETIIKKQKKLNEQIIEDIKNIVIYTFVEDIATDTKMEKFINTNIIKKVIKVYNPNLDIKENIEIIQRKFGNIIPGHIISLIIKSHNNLLEELKKQPKIKDFIEKNKIHTLSEMYEEMHINASIFDSDPSFEGTLIFKRMLKDPEFKENKYTVNEYLIKTYFRNLKKDIKQLNINTFSFNQLLNAKLSSDKNFKTEKIDKYLKELKENYLKEGTIPIAITNSTNNAFIVYVKYKYPLDFNNLNSIEEHIPNINHITKIVNYLYNINRLINSANSLSKELESKLVKEAKEMENYLINTYGNYYIVENPIDRLYKRKEIEYKLDDIIKKYKDNLSEAKKFVKQLANEIKQEAKQLYDMYKNSKQMTFRTFHIKNETEEKELREGKTILNNKLRSNTLYPVLKRTILDEKIQIYDVQAELNRLKIEKKEILNYKSQEENSHSLNQ